MLPEAQRAEEQNYVSLVEEYALTKSLYYARGYDITNTYQVNNTIKKLHISG
jgi:hypothetical protein